MAKELIKEFEIEPKDIGQFLIKVKIFDYIMDFECYECKKMSENNEPMYQDSNGHFVPDEEASRYLYGSLKWDGCINMVFDEEINDGEGKIFMLHYCGLEDFENTWKLMQQIYDLGRTHIPHWSE